MKQQFEYVDFVEDVLNPESEALLAGRVRLEIEEGAQDAAESIITIHVEAEDSAE